MAGLVILAICGILTAGNPAAGPGTRFLHQPDISRDAIVFVYAADLWTVSPAGGRARRLTVHPGSESNPKFSPDGEWIAFSGQYDGNTDVYLVPSEGGLPQRITYHPSPDLVQGWTPDGKRILFKSGRTSHNRKFNTLFTVDKEGGFPEELPVPMAEFASLSPDGKSIAYNPIYQFWQPNWRRYRGGTAPPVWVVNLADLLRERVSEVLSRRRVDLTVPEELLTHGDETLLGRGLGNLLENAEKYGGKGPIDVRAGSGDGWIWLRIENEGTPIPEALRLRIFEPFFRAASQSEGSAGFGLGLPFARAVARAHGGEVELGDAVRGRVAFVFRLPEARAEKKPG